MPHGESWFSLLPFHKNLMQLAHLFSKPVTEDGRTWIAHEEIGLQHVYGALLVLVILLIMGLITSAGVRKSKETNDLLPEAKLTVRNFVEIIVGAAYRMMADIMGEEPARYFLPLIGTCGFFILLSNALGLIPGFLPPTSKLDTTLALGTIIFLTTHFYGIKKQGVFNYFKHFLGPIISLPALPLMLLFFVIEMISHIARPCSLGIRLMANMTADHMVVAAFLGLVPFLVPIPMMLLGCIVVIVQALVFCLLSTIYITEAIKHTEHH
jgi:F-type H+-transporting ATPase subunit a